MTKKIYKLFGIKILEIETLEGVYQEPKKPLFRKPAGEVLTYSPEEAKRDEERKFEKLLEKR